MEFLEYAPVFKIFANGSTTLQNRIREALGVNAGDSVRYVISEKGVQIVKVQSVPETADMLAGNGQS